MKLPYESGLPRRRCYTNVVMRRWLLIFLVALLPMQFSWAAAASYGHHERVADAAQHLGHHEHQRDAAAVSADTADAGLNSTATSGVAEADCGTCHAGCCTALVQSDLLLLAELPSETHGTIALRLSSQPASLPERPNWHYPA